MVTFEGELNQSFDELGKGREGNGGFSLLF